jgi:hypothetical protein
VAAALGLLLPPGRAIAQNSAATTVQLPTFGISVDTEGVLRLKTLEDPTGQLRKARQAAAKANLAADVVTVSPLRKISLPRLERAIRQRLDQGRTIDDTMRNLAGLTRLQYVFYYPNEQDIVIAGPAEGWMDDGAGHIVGVTSGRATLELDDLLVALRAFPPGKPQASFVGCTIEPSVEGLVRLRRFQQQVPRTVRDDERQQVAEAMDRGIRESLGMATVRVFGVPADTHFGQVMIEADYRMKLMGLGLERPPVKISSFLELATSAQHGTLQRWWFTPDYDCVKVTADRQAMELVGLGVQLSSENKQVTPDGQILAAAAPSRASDLFAAGFTRKYPELAAQSPVYAQLRNLIDMLVASAFIRQERYCEHAGWSMPTLASEAALPVTRMRAPTQVEAAVNVVWKGSRLLAPAGGGVSISAEQALDPKRVRADEDGELAAGRKRAAGPSKAERWWWD